MTNEEKQLLQQDLCTRLPYGVMCKIQTCFVFEDGTLRRGSYDKILDLDTVTEIESWYEANELEKLKPYLRPMTSMTYEEETYAMRTFFDDSDNYTIDDVGDIFTEQQPYESVYTLSLQRLCKYMSWLLSKHFDVNHLIEKGLALEAPEDMYTIGNQ